MTKEIYKQAKLLRDLIQHFETKKIQVSSAKERKNDEEFNILRQLAFDGCDYAANKLEKEFELL